MICKVLSGLGQLQRAPRNIPPLFWTTDQEDVSYAEPIDQRIAIHKVRAIDEPLPTPTSPCHLFHPIDALMSSAFCLPHAPTTFGFFLKLKYNPVSKWVTCWWTLYWRTGSLFTWRCHAVRCALKQATSTAWFFSLIFSRHGSPRQSRQFFLHLPRLSTRVFSHGVYFLTSGRHRQLLCHLPSPPVFHYTTIHALVSLLDPWLDHFSHDDDAIHFSLNQRHKNHGSFRACIVWTHAFAGRHREFCATSLHHFSSLPVFHSQLMHVLTFFMSFSSSFCSSQRPQF